MPSRWDRYPQPVGTVKQRLLAKCRQEDRGFDTKCLVWYGEKDKDGYGRIKDGGRYVPVHHVLAGRPPDGMDKDHLCHQRDCVRPSHLEDVTRSVNTARQGKRSVRRAMTPEEKQVAIGLLQAGGTVAQVADVTGFSRRSIGRLRKEMPE
jgi:hypothetical protein